MKLKILGSGSQGNCYILESKDSALIIEAGVNFREVKIALDFDLYKIAGCLISHRHSDHSKYAKEFFKSGLDVYAPIQEGPGDGLLLMDHKIPFSLRNFHIIPLRVVHNIETFCFLIKHPEMGLCLFATDSHYIPYKFQGLNQIIIETNYDLEILDTRTLDGHTPAMVRNRVINTHMAIDTVKAFLKSNDLRSVNNICLIHLSNGHSNAQKFKTDIEGLTGKRVTIAQKGIEIDFNKEF